MSLASRLLGKTDSETESTQPEKSTEDKSGLSPEVRNALEYLFTGETFPAYDMTREQDIEFPETITLDSTTQRETLTVSITTPTNDFEFPVRITGYTSRFGEVDVEFIDVGSYALNLYHPLPDSDEYFVRRLYYYADEQGIGAEQHRDSASRPTDPDWIRADDYGSVCELNTTVARVTVYDWRQEMMTHNKPTPSSGEVIIRYRDSPNCGGNRSEEDFILTVDNLRNIIGSAVDVSFIKFDTEAGEFVLYAPISDGSWQVAHFPVDSTATVEDISWEISDANHRPSKTENVIWVRDPGETWFVGCDETETPRRTSSFF